MFWICCCTYAIVNVGWAGKKRMNMTSVLLRIVNGKIGVEADRSMHEFVDELLAAASHAMPLSSPFNRHR
jgi:hypothetical protein